jgi:[ribosomal protein S18]-alanine N-acetyltransferase
MAVLTPGIERLLSRQDAEACARMMACSEPWVTLGRTYEASLSIVQDSTRETYIARADGTVAGFLIICMTGAFVGYIQTVCIHPDYRGRGLGSRLVVFAEERILSEVPNVFMCVSSFNHDARRLYERLGYQVVGELTDYIVAGHSEILLQEHWSADHISGHDPAARTGDAGIATALSVAVPWWTFRVWRLLRLRARIEDARSTFAAGIRRPLSHTYARTVGARSSHR